MRSRGCRDTRVLPLHWAAILLPIAVPAPALSQTAGTPVESPGPSPTVPTNCDDSARAAEIVVCGDRSSRSRYRIPEQVYQKPVRGVSRPVGSGEVVSHGVQVASDAPCGPFQGQRTCSRSEAALYGYQSGRDPITFVSNIIRKATDK